MWFKNDGVPSLLVEDGKTVTLTAANAELPAMVLRPLTTAAFLVACGIVPSTPARMCDPAAFQRLKTTEGYVSIKLPSPDGRIGGYTSSFLRHILTSLNSDAPMPESVRLRTSAQRTSAVGEQRTAARVRNVSVSAEQGLVDIEIPLPEFMRHFGLVTPIAHVKDIVVGVNSTLVLDASITHLLVNDFVCYRGSKIIQESSYLALDVCGTMIGGLFDVIHQIAHEGLLINFDLVREHVLN